MPRKTKESWMKMKITISDKCQAWFKKELDLSPGDGIRFFGKYGGSTNVHVGFTTGMMIGLPSAQTLGQAVLAGITYFVDETDDWFFHGYDLTVDFNETLNEPVYTYQAQ